MRIFRPLVPSGSLVLFVVTGIAGPAPAQLEEVWLATYDGPDSDQDGARALALDPAGTVYVTGGGYTVRYDASGAELAATSHDFDIEAMVVDAAGNIYLAGRREDPSTQRDFVTAKYLPQTPARFRRGDANADGRQDLSDAVTILSYLFTGTSEPACGKSADLDDSGTVEITDPIFLLQGLFLGGPPPREPFENCGPDPTADSLSCGLFPPCQ